METKSFFGIILRLSFIALVFGQGCLRVRKRGTSPPSDEPPFGDDNNQPLPASSAVQAIITTYRLYCDCVNITSWQTYLEPGGTSHNTARGYDIIFQVWRPSPTVQDDGCYSLVGENVFTSFTFDDGGFVELTPTPPINSIITAQSGDVVGYYTNSHTGNNQGIQLERDGDYDENIIWFLSIADGSLPSSGNNACPYPVGTDRYLSNYTGAAPMLKLISTTVTCPPSPSPIWTTSQLEQLSSLFVEVATTGVPLSSLTSVLISSLMSKTDQTFSTTAASYTTEVSTTPSLQSKVAVISATLIVVDSISEPTVSSSNEVVSRVKSLSSRGSMHSKLISPSLTPITNDLNEGRTNSVLPWVIVIVIALLVISFVVVVAVAVLLRKRVSIRKLNNDVRNLSNPNYDSSLDTLRNKGSKNSNLQNSPIEPTYEDFDDSAVNYSLCSPLEYSYAVQGYPQTKESSFNSDKSIQDELYHEVGPDIGSRKSTTISSDLPPVPECLSVGKRSMKAKKAESGHVTVYEEPLPSAHIKAKKSVGNKDVFDTIGNYVPTEEQRHESSGFPNQASSVNECKDLKFFVEDPRYWSPASTTTELYSQLATKKYREISRNQIRLDCILGSGQFGEVYKAMWNVDKHSLELAVKTLKSGASEEDSVKFLREAAIMGQFNHRNVIKMHGVITLGEPILICLEILDHGDLRDYLLKYSPHGSKYDDFMETELIFLRFAKDISTGMDYLSKKNFVHRDLAARNILLNKYLTCKISDFGMARDLMDDTYYTSSGGKIPVKWTAPEALLFKKYSTDSDVWSYGMVLFEIWSVGRKPFSNLTNNQTLTLLQQGFCQSPPPGCPRAIYELMVNCWNPEHQCRPSFTSICQKLNESPEKLLYWSPSDDSLSSQVGICGAELLQAENLYPDLQKKYIN